MKKEKQGKGKKVCRVTAYSLLIRLILAGGISAGVISGWSPSTGRLVAQTSGFDVPSKIIKSSDGNFILLYYSVPPSVASNLNGSNDFNLYGLKVDLNGNVIWVVQEMKG